MSLAGDHTAVVSCREGQGQDTLIDVVEIDAHERRLLRLAILFLGGRIFVFILAFVAIFARALLRRSIPFRLRVG